MEWNYYTFENVKKNLNKKQTKKISKFGNLLNCTAMSHDSFVISQRL